MKKERVKEGKKRGKVMITIKIGIGIVIMNAILLAGVVFSHFGTMGYPLMVLIFFIAAILIILLLMLNHCMVQQDKKANKN